ncbi:MAG TPA: type II toxin-antitoxin system HicA family toxin [Gemmatimonadota bacterium]|nr:type II toxin-antitoxin system HicA family toxin [Gemmatimonadota bacterium]
MPDVPLRRPREIVKAFQTLGREVARQKGSHIILVKGGHPATLSVPNHSQVARGTLRGLISKAGLTVEEFLEALKGQQSP